MKTALVLLTAFALSGCFTQPKIESTKQWEGHYYSFEDLKKGIDGAQLDNDESIWIFSNHTLNRLLRNTKK